LARNAKNEEWPAFDGVDRGEWSRRLRNLALLQKSKNLRLGNKSFAIKKPKLAESDLLLTKMIGEKDDWTPDTVRERQTELAELAISVWPREP
jgi:hypothetical protein